MMKERSIGGRSQLLVWKGETTNKEYVLLLTELDGSGVTTDRIITWLNNVEEYHDSIRGIVAYDRPLSFQIPDYWDEGIFNDASLQGMSLTVANSMRCGMLDAAEIVDCLCEIYADHRNWVQ
jgi:hypothetical protein